MAQRMAFLFSFGVYYITSVGIVSQMIDAMLYTFRFEKKTLPLDGWTRLKKKTPHNLLLVTVKRSVKSIHALISEAGHKKSNVTKPAISSAFSLDGVWKFCNVKLGLLFRIQITFVPMKE